MKKMVAVPIALVMGCAASQRVAVHSSRHLLEEAQTVVVSHLSLLDVLPRESREQDILVDATCGFDGSLDEWDRAQRVTHASESIIHSTRVMHHALALLGGPGRPRALFKRAVEENDVPSAMVLLRYFDAVDTKANVDDVLPSSCRALFASGVVARQLRSLLRMEDDERAAQFARRFAFVITQSPWVRPLNHPEYVLHEEMVSRMRVSDFDGAHRLVTLFNLPSEMERHAAYGTAINAFADHYATGDAMALKTVEHLLASFAFSVAEGGAISDEAYAIAAEHLLQCERDKCGGSAASVERVRGFPRASRQMFVRRLFDVRPVFTRLQMIQGIMVALGIHADDVMDRLHGVYAREATSLQLHLNTPALVVDPARMMVYLHDTMGMRFGDEDDCAAMLSEEDTFSGEHKGCGALLALARTTSAQ